MKKFLSILIAALMLISMVPAAVFADEAGSSVSDFIKVEFGDGTNPEFEILDNEMNQSFSDDTAVANTITVTYKRNVTSLYVDGSVTCESEGGSIIKSIHVSELKPNESTSATFDVASFGHYTIDLTVFETVDNQGKGDPGIYNFYTEFDYYPGDAVAKFSYVDFSSDEPVNVASYYTTIKNAIHEANEYGLKEKNGYNVYDGTLVLFDDVNGNDFADCETLSAGIKFDANGHQVGSTDYPISVNAYVDFYNLAGDFYVKAMSYDGTLISVYKPEIVVKEKPFNHIELSLGGAPQTYCFSSIIFFWGYDDLEENPVYPSVSLNSDGYFALLGAYGSIRIAKTTDYPYALLKKDGTFDFFHTLSDALKTLKEASENYDEHIYLMDYVHVGNTEAERYEINKYNYVGSLDQDTIAKLRTMVRVTDGKVSDFYTLNSDNWEKLYSNHSGNPLTADLSNINYVTLNVIDGEETTTPDKGTVNIKKGWGNPITSSTTWTWPETPTQETTNYAGSYIIGGNGEVTLTIDYSNYNLTDPLANFTLVSQNPNAILDITSNNENNQNPNIAFDIVGDYKSIRVNNADAKIGANLDYKGDADQPSGKLPTNVGCLESNGASNITVGNETDDYVVSIGSAALNDSTEASFEYVLFNSDDAVVRAVSISRNSYALIYNSDIIMTGANADTTSHEVVGIENQGMLGLMDTGIKISDLDQKDYAYGIFNLTSGYSIIDNSKEGKEINLSKGCAIASARYSTEKATENYPLTTISGANIHVGGSNPDGKAVGIYQSGGKILLRPGYGMYDDTDVAPINIKVDDSNGYGLYIENPENQDGSTMWSITGPKNSVTVKANTSIYSDSTESYSPNFSNYNVTTGKYLGKIKVCNECDLEAMKMLLPNVNYYAKPVNGGYEVVYEEYELAHYLESNNQYAVPFVLHSNIQIGWADSYSLAADFYNSYDAINVVGNKAVDMNGYRIDSYTRSFDEALIVVPDNAALWLYTTKPNADNGNEIRLYNGYSVVAVVANDDLTSGGRFINGAKPGEGKYGVSLISSTEGETSAAAAYDSVALAQNGGHVDLYGGTYNGMVLCGMGEMNIYGGSYHGLVEMFAGEPGEGINLYGGKLYPSISLMDEDSNELVLIMNMTALYVLLDAGDFIYRTVQYDKNAITPFEDKEGKQILPQSYMMVDGTKIIAHGGTIKEDGSSLLADYVTITADGSANDVYAEVVGYVFPSDDSGSGSSKKKEPKEEEPKINFVDVNESDWFYDNVVYVATNGLMNGVSAYLFDPNGQTTRGMMMTILARMDGCDTEGGEEWYSIGMNWAKTNGISDGTNPTGLITREQFASMLFRYAKANGRNVDKDSENVNTLSYNDIFDVSSWATEGVHWCLATGIINGKTINGVEGYVDPQGLLTRAEAAAMIQRFCEVTCTPGL